MRALPPCVKDVARIALFGDALAFDRAGANTIKGTKISSRVIGTAFGNGAGGVALMVALIGYACVNGFVTAPKTTSD